MTSFLQRSSDQSVDQEVLYAIVKDVLLVL